MVAVGSGWDVFVKAVVGVGSAAGATQADNTISDMEVRHKKARIADLGESLVFI